MGELRTQLGSEMVAAHEQRNKLAALTDLHNDLKTKHAVLDEQVGPSAFDHPRL